MLTIGKIGGSGVGWRSPGYYTEQVAQGVEDYYAGRGEAPGTWTGAGAARLGLRGEVDEDGLGALFERRDPASGELLGRVPGEGSVRGFDLQVAVPKSVSTLWALADEYGHSEVAGKVWEATHGAAAAALDYLERNACTSRAGAGGRVALRGEGFVGAVFPHRFSREGDPQVHVHVLVANLTHGGAGEGVEPGWRTLDARDLYNHKLAAGYLFQAELRERLTRELGVEWTEVEKGAAEVRGVPGSLTEALSKRRAQILDALARESRSGSACEAEVAALATRRSKESFDLAEQRGQWRAVAEEHGFGPAELGRTVDRTGFRPADRFELAAAGRELAGPEGLTRERSTFTRRDVVRELAARHGRGGSVREIEAAAEALIASDRVTRLDASPVGVRGGPLLTTPEMLEVEARMVDLAVSRAGEGASVVELGEREPFERRSGGLVLSDEQEAMVSRLVTSGHGVELVRARAGTGKTTAIDAARELWEREGYRVIGAALAGRAADELHARAGIDSYTIHGLLGSLDAHDGWRPDDKTVLVVDEAGMVDTRRIARLLDHAADARAKVVLVGDERQVPAVEAGGAFAGLADRLGAIELSEVHRQRHAWDRAALEQLRHGDVGEWVAAYHAHGRIVGCQSADEQTRTLVADWYVAARDHGYERTLMLAPRRHEVSDLNHLARAARVAAGQLDDETALTVDGGSFAVGDRVLASRNRHVDRTDGQLGRHRLRNGNRGTVTRIDRQAGELIVLLDTGPQVRLPADYLRDGHVEHGYAMTAHKAQGMTCERTFVLASPGLARELGYVAASRHTDEARFYVNTPDTGSPPDRTEPALEDRDLFADLRRALGQERAKQLALDHTETDRALDGMSNAELMEIQQQGRELLSALPHHTLRDKEARDLDHAADALNGTTQRLADACARLDQLGRFDRKRRAELQQLIERLEDAQRGQRDRHAELTEQHAAQGLDRWLGQHELQIAEATAADRELATRHADARRRATRAVTVDPDTAERALGQRPDDPAGRERWTEAATAHHAYQLQYGHDPDGRALADLPGRQRHDRSIALELARQIHPDRGRADRAEDLGPDLAP